MSIEEKWINNAIAQDTYERWYSSITKNKLELGAVIDRLSGDQHKSYKIIKDNLDRLTDLGFVYKYATTLEKQELIRIEFDSNLYYEKSMYRTPTMLDFLSHNAVIMKERGLLEYTKKRDSFPTIPLSGPDGTRTRDLRRDRAAF